MANVLLDGWNPFLLPLDAFLDEEKQVLLVPTINRKTLIQAIDFGLENGSWATKTKQGYKSTSEFYKTAAKKLGLLNMY